MILQTQRLFIRQFELKDAGKMYQLNNDPDVLRYTGDLPFSSIQAARNFLANYQDYQKNGYGRWAVVHKETQHFIGWCGLKYHLEDFTDIGFRFFQKEWNKGYATESAKAVLDYGFDTLKLTKIIGRVSSHNKASIKVLEKLEMEWWKVEKVEGMGQCRIYKKEL